jgi:hypothetical protein
MQCSSTGDLYEFDKESKPSWKKHILSEETSANISLSSSAGRALHGLLGANSVSLFLITKVCENFILSYWEKLAYPNLLGTKRLGCCLKLLHTEGKHYV